MVSSVKKWAGQWPLCPEHTDIKRTHSQIMHGCAHAWTKGQIPSFSCEIAQ